MQPNVQILLATYNGARFIREQLDSLFNQTYQNFTILIRDDGSTDNTMQIVKEYEQKYPSKIECVADNKKNVGATQNFGILMQQATANYIFFCDQDDIWLENKLALCLEELIKLETQFPTAPCMVYTDMESIEETGKTTANSVWKQLNLHPKYFTLNRLLIQNIPHGCTMGINKKMLALAVPLPPEAILHDQWIALLAAVCGKHSAIYTPLVLLRNHAQNVTRKKNSLTEKTKRFSANFFSNETYEYFITIRVKQAKALLLRIKTYATPTQIDIINAFIQLENTKGITRKKIILKYQFFRTTIRHTLKFIARA